MFKSRLSKMNKEKNRSAAGLRRSAIAERIRIREEWSALKEIDTQNHLPVRKPTRVVSKKNIYFKPAERVNQKLKKTYKENNISSSMQIHSSSDVLHGIVVLVDVGSERRALALRAALAALGATVVTDWSPLVTHLVWSKGGCRATRAKARALAMALVSPLWVEACAAANKRLPERSFPSATRPSDLPSPRTMKQILKRAEMENISFDESDSKDENENRMVKLRISSDQNTSTEKTADSSENKTHGKSESSTEQHRGVRRIVPSKEPSKKVKRKLFTQKEVELTRRQTDDESEDESTHPRTQKLTQRDKRDIAHAERITRRLLKACNAHTQPIQTINEIYRIVLTGMHRRERHSVAQAVRSLNGRIQKEVDKHTTHVILGSCREDGDIPPNQSKRTLHSNGVRARTLNALLGAARGCRVLTAQWALDSAAHKKWLHYHNYVVPHLKKISLRARVERTALGYQHTNYAYNIFHGIRACIYPNAEQRDAASKLLKLCGAKLQDGSLNEYGAQNQDGRLLQDGGKQTADIDVRIGVDSGTVSSKWVFDSVASGRMRTMRRYLNETGNDTIDNLNALMECSLGQINR